MDDRKLRERKSASPRSSISEHASDWIHLFSKQFEAHFIDSASSIPADASSCDYQEATIRATFSALLDSGMDAESYAETVGQVLLEKRLGSIRWNSQLNQRRFELIDKEIQETLTPAEKIELAGLTRIMREQLESEANTAMGGAKALHRKLLKLAGKDKPN